MKKIKAPIDGKNVATDWVEEIFDHCNAVGGSKYGAERICGYIDNNLVEAMYYTDHNVIAWSIYGVNVEMEYEHIKRELTKRLKEHEDPDRELFSELEEKGENSIWQSFFWRQEDED